MFVYEKKLQYPVKIDKPNPRLASIIISQYGGPDGELGASLRYLSQRYSMPFDEPNATSYKEFDKEKVRWYDLNAVEETQKGQLIAMQIIDFHTHIYPDAIAHKAAQSIRDFYHIGGGNLDGTVDQLLQCGDEAGINRFVVLPVGLKPDHVGHINDFILQQTKLQPRFTGFGTLHAAMPDIADETERILSIGLRGVKMHPDSQVFAIDDPRLFPAYEILQGKAPVILHMGDVRFDYSHPMRLRRVLELFPDLEVIAAHFGGYSMYDVAYEALRDKKCFFDISSSMMFMDDGVAEKYIRIYGAERLVFGSDFPLWDPRTEVRYFLDLKITAREKEQIAYKTALHILKED